MVIAPLVAAWSLATPLGAAYDEHQHLWRSAALVRGQILPPNVRTSSGVQTTVRVPGELISALRAECTAGKRDRPASCAGKARPQPRLVTVINSAGRYPPAYYGLVGWPTLVARGVAAVWGARAISAFLVTALLALSLYLLRLQGSAGTGAMGFAVAVTPMCLFLGAVLNASGVEIAAAIASWVAMLRFADRRTQTGGLRWASALAAAALALTRPTGPLILAIIVVVGIALAGSQRVRTLAHDKSVRAPAVFVGVCVMAQLAWLLVAGIHLTALPGTPHLTPLSMIQRDLGREMGQLRLMVGTVGWGETSAPLLTLVAWAAAGGLLMFVALRDGGLGRLRVVLALVVAIVAVQLTFDLIYLNTVGPFWGGRYSLPLAVGIPLLLAGRMSAPRGVSGRIVVGLTAVGHLAAFCWALHRFAAGVKAPLFAHPLWQPPGGVWLAVGMFAAAIAVHTAFLTLDPATLR